MSSWPDPARALVALRWSDREAWRAKIRESFREHTTYAATAVALDVSVRSLMRWAREDPSLRAAPPAAEPKA